MAASGNPTKPTVSVTTLKKYPEKPKGAPKG